MQGVVGRGGRAASRLSRLRIFGLGSPAGSEGFTGRRSVTAADTCGTLGGPGALLGAPLDGRKGLSAVPEVPCWPSGPRPPSFLPHPRVGGTRSFLRSNLRGILEVRFRASKRLPPGTLLAVP